VVKSLEKIVKEEALNNTSDVANDAVAVDLGYNDFNLLAPPIPLLKLRIRNTTQYLSRRILILNRDNFTYQICHTSVKENKSLQLEVHHTKAFDDICKENNVSIVEQASECKELWSVSNGVSICYR
jgi:hypothetical protein